MDEMTPQKFNRPGAGEIIAAAGFVMIIVSTFLPFTPIDERTWREIGVGFPVLIFSIPGIVMILRKKFFSAFFIAMFAAFFVSHAIIICYDTRAIEIERELAPNGWFRLVAMIFRDAMSMGHGSYWGIVGSTITLIAIIVGWPYHTLRENKEAARIGLLEEDLDSETEESQLASQSGSEEDSDYVVEVDDEYLDQSR